MKFSVFYTFAFVLLWTLVVVALPTEIDGSLDATQFDNLDYVPEVSPPQVNNTPGFTSITTDPQEADTLESLALGINCRGSLACSGLCPPANFAAIRRYVDQIPDDVQYQNGHQIACVRCNNVSYSAICAFVQHAKEGEMVSAATVKEKIHRLVQHQCMKCGSCPIHPGNNGATGEVTVNYVWHGCGTGICPY
ncbi:killer toxin [Dothidotthia symphoricarpi CBS 119687]|uniref:Killer toxin n=1 Tax=Dothidotthia symphoricarpi CBS 119687 TaxID=1392245 RepID=A0A6A6APH9_9PLEO|nr:killer toxin [Dothidotthia symphoricarpi CBS 119687]KAF2132844.1 killer toxin [Dothidotthia symphoricarpi CBS 119687]